LVTDSCWYCGRASDVLCDGVIGRELVSSACSAPNCPNPAALVVGAGPEFAVCEPCAASPEHRRKRTCRPFDPAATRPITCDAAACRRCAVHFGWKTVMSAIVCTRGGKGHGCQHVGIHRCHAHVAAEEPGPEHAGPAEIREVVRAACAEIFASNPPVVHRDAKPDNRNRWRENAALFLAELREGRRWQEWAAAELQLRGLRVELPEHSERARIEDADRWTMQDQDIVVRNTAVGDCVLEVKSRPLYFLDPPSYPWPTALVDTVEGWAAKEVEPRAVLLVSRPAKRILVVSAKTRPRWTVKRAKDHVRNTVADFYECPRELLASMEWLVSKLLP
jgi:hypothetical protein